MRLHSICRAPVFFPNFFALYRHFTSLFPPHRILLISYSDFSYLPEHQVLLICVGRERTMCEIAPSPRPLSPRCFRACLVGRVPFRSPIQSDHSDHFKTEGQLFLYAKLLRNGTVDPPSVPAEQALGHFHLSKLP